MTEISFHFNVADRTDYVCRLLRKAVRREARVMVTGSAPTLASVDRALWSFDPLEFVPHVLLRSGEAVPARLSATPVWLVAEVGQAGDAAPHEVLVNLGTDAPDGFQSFERLIEIVTSGDDDRAAARERWKHYAARGYAIERHEVVA